jgi:hypothetical protein
MAKGRSHRNREEKKPKAEKKLPPPAATFLRPAPVARKPTAKDAAR